MSPNRLRRLNNHDHKLGPILYWMDREMRVDDNWSLLYALELGEQYDQPVGVVYNLVSDYLGGGARQYQFKLGALRELEKRFEEKGIPFFVLLTDKTANDLAKWIKHQKVGCVVTDFHPLKLNRGWKDDLAQNIDVPLIEVDAHNIVPVWVASEKQEYAAYTIRPKIHKHLDTYLEGFPSIKKRSTKWPSFPKTHWRALENISVDTSIPPVDWGKPGEKAAKAMLKSFIKVRLKGYAEKRNDPNAEQLSNLSPFFHYGMLSPQRAAFEVENADAPRKDRDAFIEEAVVRRELSDNFCFYNPDYDSFQGFPEWAQETLDEHRDDERVYIYTQEEFEQAKTHDPLWNAAQLEMVKRGKMHGYMRMYWAKKMLEWTNVPQTALRFAIELNDKYELDGRDPNGYAGVAWSIGGVHDRAWPERDIFGKIRYMSYDGCKRKFDVEEYIRRWDS